MKKRSSFARAQMAVILLFALPALLAVMGLTTDVSLLYLNWLNLRKAADSAALAAASQLTGNDVTTDDQNVVACGEQYACANGVNYQPAGTCYGIPSCTTAASSDTMTVTPADDDRSVTVHIQRSVPYFFFRLIGLKKGTVVVQATAGIYPTSGACNVVPLSLPCTAAVSGGSGYGGDGSMGTGDRSCGGGSGNGPYASGKSVTLVSDWQHTTAVPGNFEALALGSSGGARLRQNIASGFSQIIPVGGTADPYVSTEPGRDVGNVLGGFSDRMNGAAYAPLPTQIPTTSPQIVVVALADFSQAGKAGKTQVPLLDFVELWVTGVNSPDGQNALINAKVIGGTPQCGTPTTSGPGTTPYQTLLCPEAGCATIPAAWWPKTT
jgi:Flp pilus assembly protein TadG